MLSAISLLDRLTAGPHMPARPCGGARPSARVKDDSAAGPERPGPLAPDPGERDMNPDMDAACLQAAGICWPVRPQRLQSLWTTTNLIVRPLCPVPLRLDTAARS